jgi:hypothetical protein
MVDDDKDEKDRSNEDRHAASGTHKKPGPADSDDAGEDESQLSPVKPKVGEPSGNLRRRAEWFRKRH